MSEKNTKSPLVNLAYGANGSFTALASGELVLLRRLSVTDRQQIDYRHFAFLAFPELIRPASISQPWSSRTHTRAGTFEVLSRKNGGVNAGGAT